MLKKHALGRQVLAELHGCPPDKLDDPKIIQREMSAAAVAAGAEIKNAIFHHFSPYGVSGVVVISESHLAIHTWPEHGYAALDIFTCGQTIDPWIPCHYLNDILRARNMTAHEIRRGIFNTIRRHKPPAGAPGDIR